MVRLFFPFGVVLYEKGGIYKCISMSVITLQGIFFHYKAGSTVKPVLVATSNTAKCSKYPNHKSELISHLNIDSYEIFDTQTWTQKYCIMQVCIYFLKEADTLKCTCIKQASVLSKQILIIPCLIQVGLYVKIKLIAECFEC